MPKVVKFTSASADRASEGNNSYTCAGPTRRGIKWQPDAIFDYHDQRGKLVFRVHRQLATRGGKHRPEIDKKTGKQMKRCFQAWEETPDAKKPLNAPVLPYRLPELIRAVAAKQTIFVAEGEPKVDALRKWGLAATCSAEGAGKWKTEHAQFLRGADVVIYPTTTHPAATTPTRSAARWIKSQRDAGCLNCRGYLTRVTSSTGSGPVGRAHSSSNW